MATKAIHLPDVPEAGPGLEDYVAALFQASGHYVEKNLIQRDPEEVLELDVVATDYSAEEPFSTLVEAKGGAWGYPDAFKMVGWMAYLGMKRGALFVKKADKDLDAVNERITTLGLKVIMLDDFSKATDTFSDAGFGTKADDVLVTLWRHSFNRERHLTKLVQAQKKSMQDRKGPAAALDYQRLTNDGTFFARTPRESLDILYNAYKEHPKLTLAAALELDGLPFDPQVGATTSPKLIEAMRQGNHPLLQACMYTEHRARIALLKAAVDYCCAHPDGPPRLQPGQVLDWEALLYVALPTSFQDALLWLRKQPTFKRYALFWQQFMWGWGGFYLEDRVEQEFVWMSKYSGIPEAEIPTALEAYDRFFPAGGWLVAPGATDARRVKMTPMLFHGIGAHHRRQEYNVKEGFSELNCKSFYTAKDLASWVNCTVNFLA